MPFSFGSKKISEKQFIRLLKKRSTVNLKGFNIDGGTVEGLLRFDDDFKLKLEPKVQVVKTEKPAATSDADTLTCPKCNTGTVIKGKTAYGCTAYKSGCDFKMTFDAVKAKINGQKPTKALVYRILKGEV